MPRKKHPPEQDSPGPSGASLLDRDGLINSGELAAFLGVEIATLDAWASRGGGPVPTRVGRYRKYMPADVKDWLRENRHEVDREPAA